LGWDGWCGGRVGLSWSSAPEAHVVQAAASGRVGARAGGRHRAQSGRRRRRRRRAPRPAHPSPAAGAPCCRHSSAALISSPDRLAAPLPARPARHRLVRLLLISNEHTAHRQSRPGRAGHSQPTHHSSKSASTRPDAAPAVVSLERRLPRSLWASPFPPSRAETPRRWRCETHTAGRSMQTP